MVSIRRDGGTVTAQHRAAMELLGYEGEWVAIADGWVIAQAASMTTVESEARE